MMARCSVRFGVLRYPSNVFRKGEHFERGRHSSGTEIKAITYSAMQINEKENDAEVFVIVDI